MTEEVTFNDMLESFWRSKVFSFHTATPGKIISYDSSTRFATVKPLIKYQYIFEDTPREIPNIQGRSGLYAWNRVGLYSSAGVSRCNRFFDLRGKQH